MPRRNKLKSDSKPQSYVRLQEEDHFKLSRMSKTTGESIPTLLHLAVKAYSAAQVPFFEEKPKSLRKGIPKVNHEED